MLKKALNRVRRAIESGWNPVGFQIEPGTIGIVSASLGSIVLDYPGSPPVRDAIAAALCAAMLPPVTEFQQVCLWESETGRNQSNVLALIDRAIAANS